MAFLWAFHWLITWWNKSLHCLKPLSLYSPFIIIHIFFLNIEKHPNWNLGNRHGKLRVTLHAAHLKALAEIKRDFSFIFNFIKTSHILCHIIGTQEYPHVYYVFGFFLEEGLKMYFFCRSDGADKNLILNRNMNKCIKVNLQRRPLCVHFHFLKAYVFGLTTWNSIKYYQQCNNYNTGRRH